MADGIEVQERPVVTDSSAYGHQRIASSPEVPRPLDVAPVFEAAGRIAKAIGYHIDTLYRQDQEIAVVKAKNDISSGLLKAAQSAQQQTDWTSIARTFSDESAALKQQVLGSAPDRNTQLKIQEFYDQSVLRTSASVAQNVLQKKNDGIRADAVKTREFINSNIAGDPERRDPSDPASARLSTAQKQQSYDLEWNLFRAGAIDAEQREKNILADNSRTDETGAEYHIQEDPKNALKLLQDKRTDESGVDIYRNFVDLPIGKRLEMEARAGHAGRAEQSNVGELMKQNVDSLLAGGEGATEAQMRAHHATDAQLEDFQGETKAAQDARSMLVKLAHTPEGPESAALLKAYADQARAPDTGRYHNQLLGAVQQAYLADLQARKADPAGYVYASNPDARIPGDLQNRARWALSQQKALGIPDYQQRVLTNSESTALVNEFNDAPGDRKVAVVAKIANSYGAVYGDKIGQELLNNRIKPSFALMFGQTKGTVLGDIAKSADLNLAETEGIADKSDLKDFKSAFNTEWQTIVPRLDPDPHMQAIVHDGLYRLALQYRGSETDPVKAAIKNAYRDNYYDKTPFSIPKTVPEQYVKSIVSTANSIVSNADKLDINVGSTDPVERKLMTDKVLQGARWIPAMNDQGVALYSPMLRQVVTNTKGEIIQFRFSAGTTDSHGLLEAGLIERGAPAGTIAAARQQGRGFAPALPGIRPADAAELNKRPEMFEINVDRANREFHELSRPTDELDDGLANPPSPRDKRPKDPRVTTATTRRR